MPKPPKVTDIQSAHSRKIINGTLPDIIKKPYDPRRELMGTLTWTIESAIGYILKDFDYEKNINSNIAIGIRMLASTIERLRERHT